MKDRKVILSVTAHPDDEALGFGASAAKWSAEGHLIYNCILSGDVEARQFRPDVDLLHHHTNKSQEILGAQAPILGNFPNIKFNTVPHLELVQFIEKVIEQIQPDYIFTHHPYDLNNDHYQVSKACQAASRLFQRRDNIKPIKGLFLMEIPSSTDWAYSIDGNSFQPNMFVEVGKENVMKKIEAIDAYEGVMRPYPHPRSEEVIMGLAAMRGGQGGLNYAEAFQAIYFNLDL
ncbi:PIG-L deacetylase family protein [Myroides odoratimimus]|uniref:PIG-L deacetylase family protein n=1 Tax=Myroides odoratimimus TaxID=76832 RepID=UPI00103981DC|nr:PIG-L deacetylase family protein [Myroides odoratimimus]QBK77612.1 PIG-L family deacetylase [Myroides odoratimimus]WHT73059.1 PIG-L deacetylase family protein [Myroides odoratimimus]WHU37642.1 PIG-L deacetylase family protein [Myroides odoratimimus]